MILDLCVPTVFSLDSQEGKDSHNYTKLICNSLALTAEDNTTTDKIKGDAKTRYEDLNCTTADACDICSLCEKQGGGNQGGQQEHRPENCNTPQICPNTTTPASTCASGDAGTDGGKRPKRQAASQQNGGQGGSGGKEGEGSPISQAQLDFDSEASFIHQLMKVPQEYRYDYDR